MKTESKKANEVLKLQLHKRSLNRLKRNAKYIRALICENKGNDFFNNNNIIDFIKKSLNELGALTVQNDEFYKQGKITEVRKKYISDILDSAKDDFYYSLGVLLNEDL